MDEDAAFLLSKRKTKRDEKRWCSDDSLQKFKTLICKVDLQITVYINDGACNAYIFKYFHIPTAGGVHFVWITFFCKTLLAKSYAKRNPDRGMGGHIEIICCNVLACAPNVVVNKPSPYTPVQPCRKQSNWPISWSKILEKQEVPKFIMMLLFPLMMVMKSKL